MLVDASLNAPDASLSVMLNTAEAGSPAAGYAGPFRAGARVPVQRSAAGVAYVEIRDSPASEVLVLGNHPQAQPGEVIA